jgi:hypothetical protein
MRQSIWTTPLSQPQSFITKGKQRLKQNMDTVYLKNGDEFEIELFNPTHNKILAKIEMNGKSIGAGIILRPGERVFLERYLDEAKKFLFETYVVDGDDKEVKQAIANNGDVTIKFFDEIVRATYLSGSSTLTISNPAWINTGTPYTYTTHNTIGGTTFNTTGISTTSANTFYNNTTYTSGTKLDVKNYYNGGSKPVSPKKMLKTSLRSMETGRVEKGSDSNQSFSYDNTSFNSYPSSTNWWKIMPQSTKPVVREDLVTYCTECGSRRKKDSHKFCPQCGTKF